jgi:hypothetical protein
MENEADEALGFCPFMTFTETYPSGSGPIASIKSRQAQRPCNSGCALYLPEEGMCSICAIAERLVGHSSTPVD